MYHQGKRGTERQTKEYYSVSLDAISTFGLGIATAYEETPLQYLLGFGTVASALGVIFGRPTSSLAVAQPILGTLAAAASFWYYSSGQSRQATVMAGLATACYANSLSNMFRKKEGGLLRLLKNAQNTP